MFGVAAETNAGSGRSSRMAEALSKPLASNRHFAIFAAICVGFVIVGISAQSQSHGASLDAAHQGILPLYLSTMVAEWLLLLFVWRGVRAAGNDPRTLIGRWASPKAVVLEVALGLIFGIALLYIDAGITSLFPNSTAASVDTLLPRGALEIALWIGVSITAGITEEIVYRGYLAGQLAARLRSVTAAIVAQALWFGTMHAYEGVRSVTSICVLALAFGVMAVWRRQLRTNIAAHALVDIVAGIAPNLIRV